jgi:hypothetical protein
MKKKIIFTIAVLFFVVVTVFSINMAQQSSAGVSPESIAIMAEASAKDVNPDCPNGCVEGSGGCHCYKDYPQYAEAKW